MARAEPAAVPNEAPLALIETGSHGIRITAVNPKAAIEGVRVGEALADVRAGLPSLLSRAAEPRRDRAALLRLARWCGRYGPNRNADGADGLWIDVTGVAHLYGGEERLLKDLCARLGAFGLTARLGLADTLGAAHALARFGVMRASHESGSASNSPPPSWRSHAPHGRGEGLGVGGRSRSNVSNVPPSSPPYPRPLPVKGRGEGIVSATGKAAARMLSPGAWDIAPPGETEAKLAPLPVEALRLATGTVLLLKRLGLRRIGELYGLPRSALQRRFRSAESAEAVLSRLDQALGFKPEPRRPLAEPPALCVQRSWADPLVSAAALEAETARLAAELCAGLDARNLGARRVSLSLYRADGTVAEARAGLSFPCRIPEHLMALLKEKLSHLDAGFGVDVLVLAALHVEGRPAHQDALGPRLGGAARADPALLIDRLANRLSAGRVSRLEPRASHIPERAEAHVLALNGPGSPWPLPSGAPRPPFLLACPEPIRVIAEVPEGPPARFTWRRVERRVARWQGPQRIAPEWWREIGREMSRTRDYYRLEDEAGAGYWVFREGLYGREEETPCWFLHGLFG
jgi:protein ImuB